MSHGENIRTTFRKRTALFLAVLMALSVFSIIDPGLFLPKASAATAGTYTVTVAVNVTNTDGESDGLYVDAWGYGNNGTDSSETYIGRGNFNGRSGGWQEASFTTTTFPTRFYCYWWANDIDEADFGCSAYLYCNGTQLCSSSCSECRDKSTGNDDYSTSCSSSYSGRPYANSIAITGGANQTVNANYNATATSSNITATVYDNWGVAWYQSPTSWSTTGDTLSTTGSADSVTLKSTTHSDHSQTVTAKFNSLSATTSVNFRWKHRLSVTNAGSGTSGNFDDYSGATKTISAGSRTGYTFSSWSKSGTGSISSTTATNPTWTYGNGDGSLTANWTIHTSTLKVNPNGGTWNNTSNESSFTQNYNTTKSIGDPTPPTGKHFTGWTLSSGANGSFSNGTYTYGAANGTTDTLTANYDNNSFTVAYNGNGNSSGTVPGNQTKTYGTALTLATNSGNLAKTGHTFAGWNTKADGTGDDYASGGSIAATAQPKGNGETLTLYAKWTANNYTITYKWSDGTAITGLTPTSYTYGQGATLAAVPTQNGYTITGWYTSDACTGTTVSSVSDTATGNKTFYAKKTANTYTITYKWSDGTTITGLTPDSYTYGQGATLANVPTETGYTITGWYTSEACTGSTVSNVAGTATGNKTFYAKKTANTYTITYKWSDGTTITGLTPDSYTYGQGAMLATLPIVTGYTVTGWYTSDACTGTTVSSVSSTATEDKIFYAKKTANTYTITYKWSDGTTITGLTPDSYTYGQGATLASVPEETGYTITGWYTNSACTGSTVSSVSSTATEDKTFYAKKMINTFTVTWKNGDGNVIETDTDVPYGSTPSYDGSTPTKTATDQFTYTWLGWNPTISPVKEDIIYTATFESHLRSYPITWNNWDDTLIKTDTVDYGVTPEYTGDTPTRAATQQYTYTFSGWSPTIVSVTGPATYTAQFSSSVNQYTATFNANGGSEADPASVTKDYNTAIGTLPATSRSGYDFDGWFTAASGGTQITSETKIIADVEYFAHWTLIEYPITYDYAGGSLAAGVTNPVSYTVESAAITLNNPAKQGYAFAGWTGTGLGSATETVVIAAGSTGDRSYTATWTPVEVDYTVNHYKEKLDGTYELADTDNLRALTGAQVTPDRKSYTGFTAPAAQTVEVAANGSTTVTYNYTRNEYAVNYANGNADSGTLPANTSGKYEGTVTLGTNSMVRDAENGATVTTIFSLNYTGAENITKETIVSRTFSADGWATSADGERVYGNGDTFTVPAQATTLYPFFNETGVYANTTAPAPERTGYAFGGWYETARCEGDPAFAGGATITPRVNNKTYYAKWTPVEYTITYVLDGGTNVASNLTKYTIESSFTFADPSKTGYTFVNWTEGGNVVTGIVAGQTGNKTITANWTKNTYTVTFDGNGATGGTMTDQSFVYDEAQNLTENDYERKYTVTFDANGGSVTPASSVAAYTFDGWTYDGNSYADKAEVSNLTTVQNGTVTMTAQWTAASVTLPTPTRDGYTFAGWYSGETKIGDAGDDYTPTADISLKAKWTLNTYIITYFMNDDDGDIKAVEASNPAEYSYEDESFTLNNPTRKGYEFTGWTGTGLDGETIEVTIAKNSTGNREYTANWQIIEYSVTWDLNDISDTADPTFTVPSDKYTVETATFTIADPEMSGYTFTGWTVNDGEDLVKGLTIEQGSIGNINLKANWSVNEVGYTVEHYQQNIGGGDDLELNYTLKDTDNLTGETDTFATPDRKNYEGFTAPAAQSVLIAGTGDAVIRYYYTRHTHTVTWKNWDGAVLETDATVWYGQTPEYNGDTPVKAKDDTNHYTFKGWDPAVTPLGDADATYTAEFNTLAHTYGTAEYEWSEDGKSCTATHTCTFEGCGHVETETAVIPAEGETPAAVVTTAVDREPDCTNKGVTAYTATFSKEGFETQSTTREDIPVDPDAHGSFYTEGYVSPTCTEPGFSGDVYCGICFRKIEDGHEIPADGHGEKEIRNAKPATCGEDGNTGETWCLVCGQMVDPGTVIPATGNHTWGEWTPVTAATCVTAGGEKRVCSVCGKEETRGIPAYGHARTELRNAKEATCTEDGYTGDVYCLICNELIEEGEVIGMLGHNWGEWAVVKPATCGGPGESRRYCSRCGDYETQPIDALEHRWSEVRYQWSSDRTSCRAYVLCLNNASHVMDEVATAVALDETDGTVTYTVSFTNPMFASTTTTVKPADPEDPNSGSGSGSGSGNNGGSSTGAADKGFRCPMCDQNDAVQRSDSFFLYKWIIAIVHFFRHLIAVLLSI